LALVAAGNAGILETVHYHFLPRGSNLGGGARFSAPVQTGPGVHPASCTVGTESFPGGKERLGRDADPSPLLVPWSRKSRAIPLLPLWAVRPVQSLSACTRVHFIFYLPLPPTSFAVRPAQISHWKLPSKLSRYKNQSLSTEFCLTNRFIPKTLAQ
jgi:hypothetical protein